MNSVNSGGLASSFQERKALAGRNCLESGKVNQPRKSASNRGF